MAVQIDLDLMRKAAEGDRESFARIVEEYHDPIRRVSYMLLHNYAAAEDVTQETFTRGLAEIASYRGQGKPLSWFYTIALNLSRKKLRDDKRKASTADPEVLESGRRINFKARGILTSLVRRETRQQLAIAMGFLTEPQQEAFVLHYVEELPYEAIAEIVGGTAGAARALSHRARQVLKERMPHLDI